MADGARQGADGKPRMGVWWMILALVTLVVVAWGGWLLAQPQHGRTASADRPPGLAASAGQPSASEDSAAAAVDDSPAARPSASGRPQASASAGARPSASGRPHASGPGRPQTTARAASAGEGPQDGATAQQTESVRLPGVPPAPRKSRWLVARPLPADAIARGSLVPGFPRSLLPTPRWAHVRISSVTSDADSMQATLQAGMGHRGRALLEHFREALIPRGFGVFESPALGSQRALRFSRHADSVVVTVDPAHASYSVYAVLHAAPRR